MNIKFTKGELVKLNKDYYNLTLYNGYKIVYNIYPLLQKCERGFFVNHSEGSDS
jgi:hypothetical protein